MDIFLILQILFDAVILFGVLFLFHFSVNQSQKKREEFDILKNVQVQEMKENLQELLMTLKQLGKEVSDNIQDQVREAEEKIELFKKNIAKLQKDLNKITELAEEVNSERNRLEEKTKVLEIAKKNIPKIFSGFEKPRLVSSDELSNKVSKTLKVKEVKRSEGFNNRKGAVGFSSEMVQEVYRLVDVEMSLNEIVRRTKLSRAEVQLIVNLRGNRFTTPN
jgi:DNA repair exonuclease SbcCD ATPase subunit